MDKKKFVEAGKARIAAALKAQPHRGEPSFADLEAVGVAILQHLVEFESEAEGEKRPKETKEKPAAKDEAADTKKA